MAQTAPIALSGYQNGMKKEMGETFGLTKYNFS